MMKRLLPDVLILLGLLLLAVVFFAPVTLGGSTLIPADNLYQYEPWASFRAEQGVPEVPHNALLSDLVFQNYQWKHFLRESISNGELPLWQPNQFGGTPFLANGQHSALYPFSIIYYLLPLESAFGWFTVSQLWLAGALMYIFIRGLGLGRAAGLVAAIVYAFSSFSVVSTVHPMIQASIAWLPLILLMLEFIIQRRTILPGGEPNPVYDALPWVLIGSIALGMNFLAGHVEISYYTLLIMALYAALRLGPSFVKNLRGQLPTLAMLILTAVLGICIGAVQFIPLVEVAGDSFRTERSSLDEVLGYALPKRHVVKWLLPNAYGNPAHHSYVDVFEWQSVSHDWTRDDETRVTNTDFGIKNYVEGGVYVGILTLALAAIGLLRAKQPYRLIFALMGLISAAFMFGTPLYAVLYYLFPGIDQLHTPFRWVWPFTFVLATLAAFGTDYYLTPRPPLRLGEGGGSRGGFQTRPPTLAGLIVLIIGGLSLTGLLLSRLLFDSFEPIITRIYDGLAGADQAFPNVEAFYSYQFRNVLIFALMTLGAGAAILAIRWKKSLRGAPPWIIIAAIVLAADLFLASGDFNTAADSDWLDFTPPSVTWLMDQQEENDPFRIQAYDWGERPLIANTGWRYGLQDVRGYDSLFSKQYADYMAGIAPQTGLDFNRINPVFYDNPDALLAPELDWLNVRFIITDWIIRPQEEFGVDDLAEVNLELVYEDAGVRIYDNTNALPRAFTLPINTRFDTLPEDVEPAIIRDYQSSTVFVDVETDDEAWLVLSESYHPGWRAFLRPLGTDEDAEDEIPVARVAGNLRGVQLEQGQWTVRFRYSPTSFQLGAFTSFVSGMVVIFLALLWLWRTFVGQSADQDSARRVIKNSLAPIFLNLFNRGIDFAFAFIMLRILAPEGAGIYYYAIVIFGWFDILTNFGLNTLLTREVSRDHTKARRYLVNTTGLRLGLAGIGFRS